jgi:hypothetical protein
MDEQQLIHAVRRHAMKNYDKGWDIVVECWADGDILEAIEDASTEAEAISRVARIAKLHEERRIEIESTIF